MGINLSQVSIRHEDITSNITELRNKKNRIFYGDLKHHN